jgi:hypothetical protein
MRLPLSAAVCWVPQGEAQCRPVGVPQGEAQYRPVGTSKGEALSCQGPFPAASPFVALPAESAVVPEGAFPVASSVVALPVESAVVPEAAPPVVSPVVAPPTCLSHLPRLHEKIMLSIVGRRAMSAASALTPTNTNFIITDRLGSVSSSAATPHSSTEKALMGDQFSWVPYLLISVAQFAADYAQLNWLPQDS